MYRKQFDNDVSSFLYSHFERTVKKILKCVLKTTGNVANAWNEIPCI